MSIIRKLRVALRDHEVAYGSMPDRINASAELRDALEEWCTFSGGPDAERTDGAWGTFCGVPVFAADCSDFELVAEDPIERLKERALEMLAKRPGGAN